PLRTNAPPASVSALEWLPSSSSTVAPLTGRTASSTTTPTMEPGAGTSEMMGCFVEEAQPANRPATMTAARRAWRMASERDGVALDERPALTEGQVVRDRDAVREPLAE